MSFTDPEEPDWMSPLIGILAVDMVRDRAVWAQHVIDALRSSVRWRTIQITASDCNPTSNRILTITLTSDVLRSRLWVVKTQEGVRAFVVGEGKEEDEQVAPWWEAVRTATERINRTAVPSRRSPESHPQGDC